MGKRLKIAGLKFDCDSPVETWRVTTLFTKEPGTIAWLDKEVKEGDVLFDIGANIGLYSVYAASKGAKVYAFEPHIINAAKLLLNTSLNTFKSSVSELKRLAIISEVATKKWTYWINPRFFFSGNRAEKYINYVK